MPCRCKLLFKFDSYKQQTWWHALYYTFNNKKTTTAQENINEQDAR